MTEQLEDLRDQLIEARNSYAKARERILPQIKALENELGDHRNGCSVIKDAISRLERAQERMQEREIVKGKRVSLFDLLLSGEGNIENYQFFSKSGRELIIGNFRLEINIQGLPFHREKTISWWEAGEELERHGKAWVAENMPGIVLAEKELFVREAMVTIRSTEAAKLKDAYMAGGVLDKIWAKFKKSGRNTNLAWKDIFVVEKARRS